MATAFSTKDIGVLRKRLQKEDPDTLCTGATTRTALDVVTAEHADDLTLEILSLHLTLYRQLRYAFEEGSSTGLLADLVHQHLSPALLPGKACSKILITSLESSVRTRVLRATDALSALGRMVDVLPPASTSSSSSTNPLVPLFQVLAEIRNPSRAELVAMNVLLPHIPISAAPTPLRENMIKDMDILDASNIRAGILSNLLLMQEEEKGEEYHQRILEPIMPLFDEKQNPTVLLNVARYLLPLLFAARPGIVSSLLMRLSSTSDNADSLSAWISVASLGANMGYLDIADLPLGELSSAITHSDSSVRLRAFQLLTGSKNILRQDAMERIKESLTYSAVLPSAGARSEFSSTIYSFFRKLKDAQEPLKRVIDSDPRTVTARSFHAWLLSDFVDPGLEIACRHPVVQAIFSLTVLKLYLDVFGQDDRTQKAVFTQERVESLFACQASEFTEVRFRSRQILESASIPLPGYRSLDAVLSQRLLDSCLSSLNHPRKTQAEAGKSALCIIFQKMVLTAGPLDEAVRFVNGLIDRLEAHIVASERELTRGIEELPLHGSIAAVRDVISCVVVRDEDTQQAWSSVFVRLDRMVDRVWEITRSVISLGPSSSTVSKPDHEIARAYDVLGAGDEDEDQAMDHTNLLSGCWRATKEAGELLAVLYRLPIIHGQAFQTMWTRDQVDQAGQRFLVWMHEVRHRGTFSRLASAFTDLVEAVKTVDDLKPLCFSWLQHELDIITTDSLSTTRRSAALPYSVLAIVSSDQKLLDVAFDALIKLASLESKSSDTTKVHAFNILKIVLLDAKQSKLLDRYFERAVMTALHAFVSPNWNVRNVGLILFSTIVHRSLAPGRGTQDFFASRSTLATRQTLANWHIKYPSIIPHITKVLGHLASSPSGNAHSPLFPILIIVRSLRWSDAGQALAEDLFEVVKPYLGSREWQIRIAAAQALSSLLSPRRAVEMVESVLDPAMDDNQLHGELLLRRHLVLEVIDWNTNGSRQSGGMLLDILESLRASPQPLVKKAALDLVCAYIETSETTNSDLRAQVVNFAQLSLNSQETLPGLSLLPTTAGEVILRHGNPNNVSELILSDAEDVQIPALEKISEMNGHVKVEHLPHLVTIILRSSNVFAQIAALDALITIPSNAGNSVNLDKSLHKLAFVLDQFVESSNCVPLREAALSGLGWCIAASDSNTSGMVDRLSARLDAYSQVERSQPSRYAALSALRPLSKILYAREASMISDSTMAGLHRLILRLLQDDDENIRIECAEIVCSGLGLQRAVCQKKALELEWEFIGSQLSAKSAQNWVNIVWDGLLDCSNFESDIKGLISKTGVDVLFEVEPPNLFRDPLVDMALAARNVISHQEVFEGDDRWAEVVRMKNQAQGVVGTGYSPIDGRFDLARKIRKRLEIWISSLLKGSGRDTMEGK